MATITLEALQQDPLAMSVARAVSLANETALAHGIDPAHSLMTITEECSAAGRVWRVHYGPRDFVGRRGGDLIVLVDERLATVVRIVRGQ
jgi:hypothetical protein